MAGKTGADAIAKAVGHICRVIVKYRAKLDAVIDAAQVASVISPAQATTAHAFVAAASDVCVIFQAIADFNSIAP